jgi:hypothetical protein
VTLFGVLALITRIVGVHDDPATRRRAATNASTLLSMSPSVVACEQMLTSSTPSVR